MAAFLLQHQFYMIGAHIAEAAQTHDTEQLDGQDALISQMHAVLDAGGRVVQFFTSNVSSIDAMSRAIKSNNVIAFVHASYTINLCQNWTDHSWWVQQLIIEIEHAFMIGAVAIVVHVGKQTHLTIEEALNNVYTALIFVHISTRNFMSVRILLETPAGQGSEICSEPHAFVHLFEKFANHKNGALSARFGICFDTCHVFVAGIDPVDYLQAIDDHANHIALVHLNDSKKAKGSQVDRHERIGHGLIGRDVLMQIASHFKSMSVPVVLETDDEPNDLREIIQALP